LQSCGVRGWGEAALRAKDRFAWKEMEDDAVMSLCARRLSATEGGRKDIHINGFDL